VPQFSHLSLSLAGTAAVALASLPFGITPANAAKVTEGTTSSIVVVEGSSNAKQFNLNTQGSSTVLVARDYLKTQGSRKFVVPAFLRDLLELFGIQTTAVTAPPNPGP
jgi:stage V sporulation protein SpoVS